MKVFTKKQLIDGYIDCSLVGSRYEVQLRLDGEWYIIKTYDGKVLSKKQRCDTYREACRIYRDTVSELNDKINLK